jgi:DNA mismatch repair protein MutS2
MALPIARRLGLPESLLHMAEAARSEQSKALAAAVERLEQVRRLYEQRLSDTDERLRAARDAQAEVDRLLAELREKRRRRWTEELAAARQFVATVREQGRGLLDAIQKQEADRHALARWTAEQHAAIETCAAESTDTPTEDVGPPQVGDEVEVSHSGIRGRLLSVEGERAWIQRGSLRFEVPAAHLRRLGGPAAPHVEVVLAPAPEDAAQEISLLGLRAREAVSQLDDFLDRALRVRCASVRIIHGLGSGALRRAVHDYLSTSPYCAAFRGGDAREGGAGVTIATLATD